MLIFENTKMLQTRGDLWFCGSHVQRLVQVTISSLPACLIQSAYEKYARPHQTTKAHFSWNACSLMEELEEVTHCSFDYETTQPVLESGCQLSTDFIHLSISVLCHSVQQPFPYLTDVPVNAPSATAVDAEETWAPMVRLMRSSWTPLHFFKCIFM